MSFTKQNLTISALHQAYFSGAISPASLISELSEQAQHLSATWLYLLSAAELQPYLDNLKNKSPNTHPLYGVPFAIKDNIDLAGVPTTAACPEFTYMPEKSAFVVEQLIKAGAIPLGKTNLDQFATGLVGTRSPYGATPNAFDPKYISGGSSSGSSVATAKGVVSFALGTDTAGSGRVPACFNNLVGLKPSKGLLSNSGLVPACRSLDCISIFTLSANDASTVLQVAASYDDSDCYARVNPLSNQLPVALNDDFTFAVPFPEQLEFFGSDSYQAAFAKAVTQLEDLGGKKITLDFEPMLDAAKLLYEGPWVAERYLATQEIIENNPQAMLDVTRTIIGAGNQSNATDAFAALYKLQELKIAADKLVLQADIMVTPTAGRHYTLAELAAEPIAYNSNLGYYTNFMNLLDYAAIAVPTSFTSDNMPFGITLFSHAMTDQKLLSFANKIQQAANLPLGATDWILPLSYPTPASNPAFVDLVVAGAHLSGMALNSQLSERQAVLLESSKTAKKYQMYAVPGKVERPALIRCQEHDHNVAAFDIEVWRLPIESFGSFVVGIAQPLGIGKVELADGRWLTGFIAEGYASTEKNISEFGGWRQYKNS